jgi:hypothetical protein
MRKRRQLDVGADGMAEVVVLGDPIPRHLSIVSFGANGRPAQSWKSAVAPMDLRDPPSVSEMDAAALSLDGVKGFIDETLQAWAEATSSVLDRALTADERAARVRGLTAQAAARVAALAAAATRAVRVAAKSHRSISVEPPAPPTEPTIDGQVSRKAFLSAVVQAFGWLTERTLSVMRDSQSPTDDILLAFGSVSDVLSSWAATIPDGVVGVASSMRAGARHSKADRERLDTIVRILDELRGGRDESTDPSTPDISQEKRMFTIADLAKIADADPKGFLEVVQKALDTLRRVAPTEAKKFAFGETGVDPYDPQAILNALRGMAPGDGLLSLIASAIGSVDVEGLSRQGGTQVAASMKSAAELRSGLAKIIGAELRAAPQGDQGDRGDRQGVPRRRPAPGDHPERRGVRHGRGRPLRHRRRRPARGRHPEDAQAGLLALTGPTRS